MSNATERLFQKKMSLKAAAKTVHLMNKLADNAAAGHCTASGPGLTGAYLAQQVETSFTIYAFSVDANGTKVPATIGDREFRVTVRGPDRVEPIIKDKNDGTYEAKLTYGMSGRYEVRISLERSAIAT